MVKTMKIKNEHLSAVFDDEAGEFEQRRLLDELEKDADLEQSWSNYALIGDVMREPEKAAVADPDFLSSMQLRLDEEDAYANVVVKDTQESKTNWLQPMSSIAIAATVAAVSIFSTQLFMQDNNVNNGNNVHIAHANIESSTPAVIPQAESTEQNVAATAASSLATNAMIAKTASTVQAQQEQLQPIALDERAKMQRYLASHIRNASRKTIAPTLRMISYNYH